MDRLGFRRVKQKFTNFTHSALAKRPRVNILRALSFYVSHYFLSQPAR